MVAGVARAGLPALAKSILQFVAVFAFKDPLLLPLLMPPPVQPVMLATVVVVGFTVAFELVGGSPGLYVWVPLSDLHFGSTVLAAPAEPAVSTPIGRQSDIAKRKPRPLRMRCSFVDQARTVGAPLPPWWRRVATTAICTDPNQ